MSPEKLKTAKILIVDDKEANIDILSGLLEMQGYANIKDTIDSRRVIDLYNSFHPDLILLDLMMPHLTGYDVMEQLKALIPIGTYLPILILTADITAEAKQRALAMGAMDFLAKPFDLVEVGLRIKNLLVARFLYLQLQDQNQQLEEKVSERTLELERINLDLNKSKEKAEASDNLKSAFIHIISHEIRTPLNEILGMYQILTDQGLSQEEKEDYLAVLQTSSDRLIKTVTDYMDIAMIVSNNVEVHLKGMEVARELFDIQQHFQKVYSSKNIPIHLLIPEKFGDLTMITDYDLFRKIISHLLDNAFEFTYKGWIDFGFTIQQESIEFFVKDTGIGIAKENRDRLFQPFMQEDVSFARSHEGNGLGLAIVSGLVKVLGGEIRLESVPHQGTGIYFSLPIEN